MFKKLDLIMLTEDYVSFETAKLLKEKGFDEPSRFWYDNNGVISQKYIDATDKPLGKDAHYHCVTISFAMKWLRENYNIHIEPRYFPMPNIYRYVIIRSPLTIENIGSHPQYFNSYEEACEEAIKYCLEILI